MNILDWIDINLRGRQPARTRFINGVWFNDWRSIENIRREARLSIFRFATIRVDLETAGYIESRKLYGGARQLRKTPKALEL